MADKNRNNPYSPLVVPGEFTGTLRSFCIQLVRIVTDIYLRLTKHQRKIDGLAWGTYTAFTIDTTKITDGTVTALTNDCFCIVRADSVKFAATGTGQEDLITGLPKAIETVETYAGGDPIYHANCIYIEKGATSISANIASDNTSAHMFTLIYPIDKGE